MGINSYLNDIIQEICLCYVLSPAIGKILIDNINNRTELYKNININLDNNEMQVLRNISTVDEFLLNRLICNVRSYDIGQNVGGNKGDFTQKEQRLMVSNYDYLKESTQDRINSRFSSCDKELINKSVKKVFNHEVGHALQCSNTGVVGVNDKNFNQLINRLSTKYPSLFKSLDELGKEDLMEAKRGMYVDKRDDEYKDARVFYAKNAYTQHIDEIFNETESLEVSEINRSQGVYTYGDGYNREVYNYESSNYRITPYGNMMKIIMGNARTFNAMYIDSITFYTYFDNFQGVSRQVFGNNNPPVFNVLNFLEEIKSKKNSMEAIVFAEKLDLFFVKCFELKVNKAITSVDSAKKADILNEKIQDFKKQMLESTSKQLISQQIIEVLETRVKSLKNKYSNESLLEELERDNDITLVKSEKEDAFSKLDDIANKMSLEQISSTDLSRELSLITEDSEFIVNMKNALQDDDIVAYNYWRENYLKKQNGFGSK